MRKLLLTLTGKTRIWVLLLLVLLSLSGCAGLVRNVPVEDRILFSQDEKTDGRFTENGLTVDYSYRLAGNNMVLEGSAHYYRSVDSLNVYLVFIDENGNVLQRDIVYYSGYRVSHSWGMIDQTFMMNWLFPRKLSVYLLIIMPNLEQSKNKLVAGERLFDRFTDFRNCYRLFDEI